MAPRLWPDFSSGQGKNIGIKFIEQKGIRQLHIKILFLLIAVKLLNDALS